MSNEVALPTSIGLGTVQFGLDYGITNKNGRVSQEEAAAILSLAVQEKVTIVDTAAAYGDSEKVIGNILASGNASATIPSKNNLKLVTKTIFFSEVKSITKHHAIQLRDRFYLSLENLQTTKVYGLLFHAADDILKPGGEKLFQAMEDLHKEGLLEKKGVSFYDITQAQAIRQLFSFDLVQFPMNVFDQRLCPHVAQWNDWEIHVRSAFLQGILLSKAKDLPTFFQPLQASLQKWESFCSEKNCSALEASLRFYQTLPSIEHVIVGAASLGQFQEIMQAQRNIQKTDKLYSNEQTDYSALAFRGDERFLDPRQWPPR